MKKYIAAVAFVALFSASAVMAASPQTVSKMVHFCANMLCDDCPFHG